MKKPKNVKVKHLSDYEKVVTIGKKTYKLNILCAPTPPELVGAELAKDLKTQVNFLVRRFRDGITQPELNAYTSFGIVKIL